MNRLERIEFEEVFGTEALRKRERKHAQSDRYAEGWVRRKGAAPLPDMRKGKPSGRVIPVSPMDKRDAEDEDGDDGRSSDLDRQGTLFAYKRNPHEYDLAFPSLTADEYADLSARLRAHVFSSERPPETRFDEELMVPSESDEYDGRPTRLDGTPIPYGHDQRRRDAWRRRRIEELTGRRPVAYPARRRRSAPQPHAPTFASPEVKHCVYCDIDAVAAKTKGDGLCRWCRDWMKRNRGELPPKRAVERRRQNRA